MIKTKLIKLLADSKKYIAYNIFWQWAALISQIIIVYIIANIIAKLPAPLNYMDVVKLLAALAVRFVSDRLASMASYRASIDVKRVLREKIFDKLLRLGSSYNEQIATSQVVQLATEGVEQLETYFGKYIPQLFYSLLAPVTLFAVLAFVSVKAAAVLLICVPLIPVSIVAVQKFAKKLLNKYWGIYTELGDSFLENLQGLTTLKIYKADEMKAGQMDEEAQRFRNVTMKVLTMQLNSTSVMDIMAYGGAATGMVVAVSEYYTGNIDAAGTVMIVFLAAEFFLPLRLLGSFFHIAMNGMAASDRIFELLDMHEDDNSETAVINVADEGIEIDISNLSFSYDGERNVLENISFELKNGSFVSLVGESGCGKSTIAGILMKRVTGWKGSVTVNGQDIRNISDIDIMKNITLVSHDSYLFKGTVRDNLMMGSPMASDDMMTAALRRVNLADFVESEGGLDMQLNERASNLSGGQKQRLAMARALLKDSGVYIFDEATSNIDIESEEMIMSVIRELAKTKSVLLISHRLANVVNSDDIYMLKDGVIVESGTHDELTANKKAYADMYENQMKLEKYKEEAVL
ncbi:ABC transporter ATP-binding protein/permease [[Bacteroides] pectinophilus]|uniref:ABC transmembrane type-1 domain-containing protein n=1 Tax=[Bacteroides] pectinophilus ATCC 43243 TaxID=483218 RepID=B7AQX2_9FIRM|nr:ABC transporter, ATP-binding protein [[Bacteroides] pectinophilus ATCC 43243]UWN96691.1 ABC transporter ATP-binding protein/permease [[Bacteroides] pectinophilus]